MTWYAVLDANNNLISTGTVVADTTHIVNSNYSVLQLPNDPTGKVWDANTKSFIDTITYNSYPRLNFIQRFTAQEFMTIKSSTDTNVQFFLYQVENSDFVEPASPIVQTGLDYLVSINMLSQQRANTIGAN